MTGLGSRVIKADGNAGDFHFLKYAEVAEQVGHLASGLFAAGIEPKQRVGVFGANSPSWMMAMQVGGMNWIHLLIYLHTLTHTHTHTHTQTHTQTHIHMHIYARTHTCLRACTHTHTHTHTRERTHTQTHTHANTNICRGTHACSHAHTHHVHSICTHPAASKH